MRLKQWDLVEIEWRDSTSYDGWMSEPASKSLAEDEDCLCRTAGYMLHRDKRHMTIVRDRGDDNVGGMMRIPTVAIKSIRKLI